MAVGDRMVMGRQRRCVAVLESVAGTREPLAATGSFYALNAKMNRRSEKIARRDLQGQDLQAQIKRKIEADFELSSFVLAPGGDLEPDIAPFLTSFFGKSEDTGSTRTYSFDDGAALKSITADFGYSEPDSTYGVGSPALGSLYSEGIIGGVCNELEFKFSGTEEPTITARGMAIKPVRTGLSHVPTAEAAAQTVISVDDARQFGEGSIVVIGGSANNIRAVTAVDIANNTITIDSGLTDPIVGTGGDGAARRVQPYSYFSAAQCAGTPGMLREGTFSLFGSAFEVVECTVKASRGFKRIADAYGTRYASFFVPVYRDITGEITLYSTEIGVREWLRTHHDRGGVLAVSTSDGGSTPKTMTLNLPNIELDDDGSFDVPAGPDGGEGRIKLTFKAKATALGAADSMNLVFA